MIREDGDRPGRRARPDQSSYNVMAGFMILGALAVTFVIVGVIVWGAIKSTEEERRRIDIKNREMKERIKKLKDQKESESQEDGSTGKDTWWNRNKKIVAGVSAPLLALAAATGVAVTASERTRQKKKDAEKPNLLGMLGWGGGLAGLAWGAWKMIRGGDSGGTQEQPAIQEFRADPNLQGPPAVPNSLPPAVLQQGPSGRAHTGAAPPAGRTVAGDRPSQALGMPANRAQYKSQRLLQAAEGTTLSEQSALPRGQQLPNRRKIPDASAKVGDESSGKSRTRQRRPTHAADNQTPKHSSKRRKMEGTPPNLSLDKGRKVCLHQSSSDMGSSLDPSQAASRTSSAPTPRREVSSPRRHGPAQDRVLQGKDVSTPTRLNGNADSLPTRSPARRELDGSPPPARGQASHLTDQGLEEGTATTASDEVAPTRGPAQDHVFRNFRQGDRHNLEQRGREHHENSTPPPGLSRRPSGNLPQHVLHGTGIDCPSGNRGRGRTIGAVPAQPSNESAVPHNGVPALDQFVNDGDVCRCTPEELNRHASEQVAKLGIDLRESKRVSSDSGDLYFRSPKGNDWHLCDVREKEQNKDGSWNITFNKNTFKNVCKGERLRSGDSQICETCKGKGYISLEPKNNKFQIKLEFRDKVGNPLPDDQQPEPVEMQYPFRIKCSDCTIMQLKPCDFCKSGIRKNEDGSFKGGVCSKCYGYTQLLVRRDGRLKHKCPKMKNMGKKQKSFWTKHWKKRTWFQYGCKGGNIFGCNVCEYETRGKVSFQQLSNQRLKLTEHFPEWMHKYKKFEWHDLRTWNRMGKARLLNTLAAGVVIVSAVALMIVCVAMPELAVTCALIVMAVHAAVVVGVIGCIVVCVCCGNPVDDSERRRLVAPGPAFLKRRRRLQAQGVPAAEFWTD